MLVSGLMILVALLFIHHQFKKWLFYIPFIIIGIVVFGAGVYPGHPITLRLLTVICDQ